MGSRRIREKDLRQVKNCLLASGHSRASGLIESFPEDHAASTWTPRDAGGEIIRDLNYTPALRKVAAQRLLRDALHADAAH